MATKRNPKSPLRAVPPPPALTEEQEFIEMVDRQDTRTRKEILLMVGRFCDAQYRAKGRAGWGGDIRKLRKDMAAVEHELATVAFIEPRRKP